MGSYPWPPGLPALPASLVDTTGGWSHAATKSGWSRRGNAAHLRSFAVHTPDSHRGPDSKFVECLRIEVQERLEQCHAELGSSLIAWRHGVRPPYRLWFESAGHIFRIQAKAKRRK